MTEQERQELRIRVAELCGWRKLTVPNVKPDDSGEIDYDNPANTITGWFAPGAETIPRNWHADDWLPDFLSDLNACAEFEKIILRDGKERWQFYKNELWKLFTAKPCAVEQQTGELYGDDLLHATAEQRCRAFVATMEAK